MARQKTPKEKILALYALRQGATTDGEREAADRKLQLLLDKHGLKLDSLFEPEREYRKFTFKHQIETRLLVHIVWAVVGSQERLNDIRIDAKKKWFFAELSEKEFIDVTVMYRVYHASFWKEVEELVVAFALRNRLFGETSGPRMKLTPEQKAAALRRNMMSEAISETPDPRSFGYLGEGKNEAN